MLDPLGAGGDSLIEAIRLGRDALAIAPRQRLAVEGLRERITQARASGASGEALLLRGEASELPRLLARQARGLLRTEAGGGASRHPCGSVDLILVSAPSGRPRRQVDPDMLFPACAAVLKPGGFLAVTKRLGHREAVSGFGGGTVRLCEQLGLQYWQHVIALLALITDGHLHPPRHRCTQRDGNDVETVHADLLVFRKPANATAKRLPAAEAA